MIDLSRLFLRLLLPCLATAAPALSQLPTGSPDAAAALSLSPSTFRDQWQSEDGLPQISVRALAQGSAGYLWLGTEEGLARFDGREFKIFDATNTSQLLSNQIEDILADEQGLWIATRGGLIRYQNGRFTGFHKDRHGLASDHFQVLYRDRQDRLWVGGRTGLTLLTERSGHGSPTAANADRDYEFINIPMDEPWLDDNVGAILETRQGDFWIGTTKGLHRLRGTNLQAEPAVYDQNDGLPSPDVRSLFEDLEGRLWVGTTEGIGILDGRTSFRVKTPEPLGTVWHISPVEDHLLVASQHGLHRIDPRSPQPSVVEPPLIPGLDLRAILSDREGSLWLGARFEGLLRLRQSRVFSFGATEGLADDVVWGMCEGADGDLWVGTHKGLNRITADHRIETWFEDRVGESPVQSVLVVGRQDIWLGLARGLVRLKDGRAIDITRDDGETLGNILAITLDQTGHVWIGTNADGLYRFPLAGFQLEHLPSDDPEYHHYSVADGLPSNRIRVLREADDGVMWVGTGNGLVRFEQGRLDGSSRPAGSDGLASNRILDIHIDREGNQWLATASGLSLHRAGRVTHFTAAHGLPAGIIMRLLEDDHGRFWLSTNHGIFSADRNQLLAIADGLLDKLVPILLSERDGMRSRECNGGVQSAGWKTGDGRLWFPTTRGVSVIHPDDLDINEVPPPVVIEQLWVDRQSVAIDSDIELAPGVRELEFHYAALSFIEPEKNQFKYKLEGFDADWIEAGDRRAAFYTNLSPGSYRFRVLAANNDGVWNEHGAVLELTLRPAFYQTRAFFVAALLLTAVIARGLHRIRMRHVLERHRIQSLEVKNAEMERFSYAVAHDLKSPLITLRGFLELIPDDAEKTDLLNRDIEQMSDAMDKMQSLLDDLLELSQAGRLEHRLEPVDIAQLAEEAAELVSGRLRQRRVELSIDDKLPVLMADRGRLRQVLQNLIDNAVKFMGRQPAPAIRIGHRRRGSDTVIFVRDNGAGIDSEHRERIFDPFGRVDTDAEGTGLGLALVRRIIESHGGRIWVESAGKDEGSTFCFTLSPATPSTADIP